MKLGATMMMVVLMMLVVIVVVMIVVIRMKAFTVGHAYTSLPHLNELNLFAFCMSI